MSRWSYDREDGSQRHRPAVTPAAVAPGRDEESRPSPQSPARQPNRPTPSPSPQPESLKRHDVLPLKRADQPQHRGRREDDRGHPRRTREQRVEHVLELVGTYRVVSRRSIVEHCFDGHTFAATRTLPALVDDGLLAVHTLRAGRKGYQVLSLTGAGRDLLAFRARKRRREADEEEDSDPQRYWTGLADVRQLQHDHQVFDAVMQDTGDVWKQGGRIRSVRLETELRGVLAAAGETARQNEGDRGAERARRQAAERIGLRVFAEGVPLPDALVEIEDADGHRSVRAIEVVTGAYTQTQVEAKKRAGFRLYALPHFASGRKQRRHSRRNVDEPFPLSWGRSR